MELKNIRGSYGASQITVPRDAGTCTRCPMECRLSSSSGSWTCQISIRWEYSSDGKRFDEVEEKPFGPVITDKTQVELALRRAQLAVLNPSVPTHKILALNSEMVSSGKFKTTNMPASLPFSRNAVCVDLSGPELADLSFVDLPGMFILSFCLRSFLLRSMSSIRHHSKCRCGHCTSGGGSCALSYQGQLYHSRHSPYEWYHCS